MTHTTYLTKQDLMIGILILYIFNSFNIVFVLSYLAVWAIPGLYTSIFVYLKSIFFALFGIFLLLSLFALIYSLYVSMFKKGILGKHLFKFTDKEIVEKTDYNDTLHQYQSIKRVFTRYKSIYIVFDNNQAHILPYRDFKTKDEKIVFLKFLYEKSKEYDFIFKSNIEFE